LVFIGKEVIMLQEPVTMEVEETAVLDPAIILPPTAAELPTEDGVPLESPWHRSEINLLLESLDYHWQDRDDYYAGGNMYIYFSIQQVRNQNYRGPDFYVVTGVDGRKPRDAWVVWEEEGRYPDLIIELLSPSTAQLDRTVKKRLYERTFNTHEYFCYDPANHTLEGWRLAGKRYQPIEADENGRMWSEVLAVWLGNWEGVFIGQTATWLRFFDEGDQLVPILAEANAALAKQEATRADEAEARAARLEAELARLRQQE
jgi:Uma2 family endonuclease